MNIQGKGFYIWQIRRTETGSATGIANLAVQAGLKHVLIKIADGTDPYNLDPTTQADLVPPVLSALRGRGIAVWGWHYVYGYEPEDEAAIAIQRIQALGLDGYVIDAEAEYKQAGREEAAITFMSRLRTALPSFPIALSSYRYPTYHPTFPWKAFLERVDINMPQVYWVESEDAGAQLIRCQREFQAISPVRPIIPTGSAYVQGDWEPTSAQVVEFMSTARGLNMPAANFWEWAHTRLYLPEIWDTIAGYNWQTGVGGDILDQYFSALNLHNVDQVMTLYLGNAVHVNPQRTLQGSDLIRQWYQALFQKLLPNAVFTLGQQSSTSSARHFSWTATSTAGKVTNGKDSIGLVDGKITYHYTYFTIT